MTKWLVAVVLAGCMAAPALAENTSAHGTWRTPERGGLVDVTMCDGGVCGRIMGGNQNGEPGERVDRNNNNPALRGRALIGLYLFRGLRPAGNTWKGAIYNPQDGGTYDATATLKSPNPLSVRGSIVWPLCKTQVWTRVK